MNSSSIDTQWRTAFWERQTAELPVGVRGEGKGSDCLVVSLVVGREAIDSEFWTTTTTTTKRNV